MRNASRRHYFLLAAGCLAASQSANLIKLSDANAFAMTAYRLSFAVVILQLLRPRSLPPLSRMALWPVLTGIALATHFFSWIYTVQNTAVATAVLLFSINPLFLIVAEILLFGKKPSVKEIMSLACFLASVLVLSLDSSISLNDPTTLVLGLASALIFSIYLLLAGRSLQNFNHWDHLKLTYGSAAVVGFGVSLLFGLELTQFLPLDWLTFLLLAVFPTILGHGLIQGALTHFSASFVAAVTLSEPVLAVIGASLFYREQLSLAHYLSFAVLLCGFALSYRKTG